MFRSNGKGIPIGKILGVPISLDWSWFAIVALLTWSLGSSYFPSRLSGYEETVYYGLGLTAAVLLFVSVLAHEVGHAIAAMVYRIPVRRIRLMFLGGIAELGEDSRTPISEFIVAIAGPAVSLLTAGFFLVSRIALNQNSLMANLEYMRPVSALLVYLMMINLLLAGFNMIPGFPLDGGRVLRSILWGITGDRARGTMIAATVGRIVAFGFIGIGFFEIILGTTTSGLWSIFIGIFLNSAAGQQVQFQRLRDLLSEFDVAQAMRRDHVFIPEYVTLQQLASNPLYGVGRRNFLVRQDERPIGYLTMKEFTKVPQSEWMTTTALQAMQPFGDAAFVEPDTVLWNALQAMEQSGLTQLPVVSHTDDFLGFVRRDDVLRFAQYARAFGSSA